MIKRKKITPGIYVASAIAFLIAVMTVTVLYLLFLEKPFLRYSNIPFPALQSVSHPGEPMPIHTARCNNDSIPHVYNITRSLERIVKPGETRDSMLMQDMNVQIMPGCSESDVLFHIIPIGTRAGMWRLVGLSEVQGVLRNHLVEWYSTPFEVSEK